MISDKKLKEWKMLCEAATGGPWEINEIKNRMRLPSYDVRHKLRDGVVVPIAKTPNGFIDQKQNAAFIAKARTAMPQLIVGVRTLKEVYSAAKEAINEYAVDYENGVKRSSDDAMLVLEEAIIKIQEDE